MLERRGQGGMSLQEKSSLSSFPSRMIQITKGSFCFFFLLLLFAIRNSRFLISSSSRSPVRGEGAEKRDRAGLERRRQERLHFPRKFLSGKHDSGESPATALREANVTFYGVKKLLRESANFSLLFQVPSFRSGVCVCALLCMGHRQTERHFFSSFSVAPPPRDDDSCIPP